ncbi:MAG: hypothetical protein ACD_38C00119G0010 [uncultured bacterium]|uniref:Pseudouridine synthase n=1 Tax=Candidatus Daviesbacteria bacterium GW2011_GWC2_40_12 TaxID=1618431 RepID=A0A0G0T3H2_9BACT|nr:MAG: hypothetical protein ACD_38C00119G0010 [uncultured bacterium]KKQ85544.1 MAG: Pseudouridine synthase [Candidatus Daviesbacteria bacterium GW2011_GWF2_38_7]KKR16072.1 MAG: Pseudouridine synthase [Candidatus Daviesbacteria bacterium GW2011_GWA2_39_33]KKR25470.1 MAG: Pseudouridine synthase [Candidatus Daviesbacteria bacterium GW2011_GWB1_39_5]KKR41640.1 MAG: Pseudouridine synthase [Candidatus Daviesbacteria bacterium GW2011_GWC2_40_12]OGE22183.1 MAG: hypothetical protein A2778_03495 [Candi
MEFSHLIRKLYEDDYLLVVEKPAGLVVDPADTVKEETLADILIRDFKINLPRGGIVHRLDKDTSGILLVAKTQAALENLQFQFKDRKTKKEYLALVHGIVALAGVVEGNIGRNPGDREKFTVLAEGKEAVTEYEPVEQCTIDNEQLTKMFPDFNKIQMRKLERQKYGKLTLLRCKPKTGRTHQIRVHLKHIGHAIVSDEKYVGRKMFRLDKRWCPRMFLHAAKLGFEHPENGEWMEFESELPEDLKKTLDLLESGS